MLCSLEALPNLSSACLLLGQLETLHMHSYQEQYERIMIAIFDQGPIILTAKKAGIWLPKHKTKRWKTQPGQKNTRSVKRGSNKYPFSGALLFALPRPSFLKNPQFFAIDVKTLIAKLDNGKLNGWPKQRHHQLSPLLEKARLFKETMRWAKNCNGNA